MAREVASTRVPGNGSRQPEAESPAVKPTETLPGARTSRPLSLVPDRPVPDRLVPHRLTPAERHRRICDLAYRRAEQRGFAPGGEVEDWLEAEREVDAGRY